MAGPNRFPARDESPRRTVGIERAEALRLLAAAPFGRIVFTHDALPAVRPVNHLIGADGAIIICTRPSGGLVSLFGRAVVLAYQADDIDPVRRIGWSVLVVGPAHAITAVELAEEYTRRLGSWDGPATGTVIGIEPTLVSGTRVIEEVAV
ncbi:pyridoxamine 5'-phosphate oxidase family protein [Nocardia sp. NPDC051750]|uniref:pyridoxamine 5'-phosphate oxidase family protein n=1 Tax=Nocardia sp. NPDC051750 TaxID=3364325 RepID=UPI003794F3C7